MTKTAVVFGLIALIVYLLAVGLGIGAILLSDFPFWRKLLWLIFPTIAILALAIFLAVVAAE